MSGEPFKLRHISASLKLSEIIEKLEHIDSNAAEYCAESVLDARHDLEVLATAGLYKKKEDFGQLSQLSYDVILFVPVKVKFVGVRASSQVEAIKKANEALMVDRVIPTRHGPFMAPGDVKPLTIDYVEPDEDVTRALVDEVGDSNYEKSQCYELNLDGVWVTERVEQKPGSNLF